MFMTTVQLPVLDTNDSHLVMNNSISNTDISIEREFQKHISDLTCAHGLIYHRKDSKLDIDSKCTERDYHLQYIKMYQKIRNIHVL